MRQQQSLGLRYQSATTAPCESRSRVDISMPQVEVSSDNHLSLQFSFHSYVGARPAAVVILRILYCVIFRHMLVPMGPAVVTKKDIPGKKTTGSVAWYPYTSMLVARFAYDVVVLVLLWLSDLGKTDVVTAARCCFH